MQETNRDRPLFAIVLVVAVQALALTWAVNRHFKIKSPLDKAKEEILVMQGVQPPPVTRPPEPVQKAPPPKAAPWVRTPDKAVTPPIAKPNPAKIEAPAAPTAADWAFAAQYTLKNSKGYRHNWGQQVRSMMGTAVEGPDQGTVRFRIETAPDGRLARLDTLWTTSATVEQRARKAVEQMPSLPPTPNG
jgi:hypothetical protein